MLLSVVLAAVSLLSVVSSSAVLPASIVSRQASANFPGEKLAGYYFVYFLGSGAANENVFTALSHGNNPCEPGLEHAERRILMHFSAVEQNHERLAGSD